MKALSVAAITLSLLAIGVSTFTAFRTDALIEQALIERERNTVKRISPAFQKIFDEFDMEIPEASRNPERIEDLFMPLVELINDLL